jgi:regulator of sigma E protease
MMGRMVIGEASLKNLSGPLTIADYAGKSASLGLSAVPGVPGPDQREPRRAEPAAAAGLGWGAPDVLSLGGVTGRSVSDAWMERLQRGGVAVLLVMMSIALFNDVTRLFG